MTKTQKDFELEGVEAIVETLALVFAAAAKIKCGASEEEVSGKVNNYIEFSRNPSSNYSKKGRDYLQSNHKTK